MVTVQRMSSVELGLKTPYSVDLRWRVVWQRIVNDLGFEKIGRGFGALRTEFVVIATTRKPHALNGIRNVYSNGP